MTGNAAMPAKDRRDMGYTESKGKTHMANTQMTRETLVEQLRDFVCDFLSADRDHVTDSASLMTDLGADTLDMVEMIMRIEEKYGIVIPDLEAGDISTFADLANAVYAHYTAESDKP